MDPFDNMPILGVGFCGGVGATAVNFGSNIVMATIETYSNACYTSALLNNAHLQISIIDTYTVTSNYILTQGTTTTSNQRPFPISTWSNVGPSYDTNLAGIAYWHSISSGSSSTWSSVCYSPESNLFVTVGKNAVMSSTNGGALWTVNHTITNGTFTSVCWSPTLRLFCAVAATDTVTVSSDATHWYITNYSTPAYALTVQWTSVCWTGTNFVAVSAKSGGSMVSPNGIDWSTQQIGLSDAYSVAYAPQSNLVCMVGLGCNAMYSSNNGATFYASKMFPAYATTYAMNSVCWSSNLQKFVAVGSNFVLESSNAVDWASNANLSVPTSAHNNYWKSIDWSPSLVQFAAVSMDGQLITSSNGVTWTSRDSQAPSGGSNFTSVCWSTTCNMFLGVSSTGVITMTNQAFLPYNDVSGQPIQARAPVDITSPFTSNVALAKYNTDLKAFQWINLFGSSNAITVDAMRSTAASVTASHLCSNVGVYQLNNQLNMTNTFVPGSNVPLGSNGCVIELEGITGLMRWSSPSDLKAITMARSPVDRSIISTSSNRVEWRSASNGVLSVSFTPLATPTGGRLNATAIEPVSGSVYLSGTAISSAPLGLLYRSGQPFAPQPSTVSGSFIAKYTPYLNAPSVGQITANTASNVAASSVYQRGAGPVLQLESATPGGNLLEGWSANQLVYSVSPYGDVTLRNEYGNQTNFNTGMFGNVNVSSNLVANNVTNSNLHVTSNAIVDGLLTTSTLQVSGDFNLDGLLKSSNGQLFMATNMNLAGIMYSSNDVHLGGPNADTMIITAGNAIINSNLTVTSNIFTSNIQYITGHYSSSTASNVYIGQSMVLGDISHNSVCVKPGFLGIGFTNAWNQVDKAFTSAANQIYVDGLVVSENMHTDELFVGFGILQANTNQVVISQMGTAPSYAMRNTEGSNIIMNVDGNVQINGNLIIKGTALFENTFHNDRLLITTYNIGVFNPMPVATLDICGSCYCQKIVVGYASILNGTDAGQTRLNDTNVLDVSGTCFVEGNVQMVTSNATSAATPTLSIINLATTGDGLFVQVPSGSLNAVARFTSATTPLLVIGPKGDTVFSTPTGEVMRVTHTNNVLVGFSTATDATGASLPPSGLDVSGSVRLRYPHVTPNAFYGDVVGNMRGYYVRCGSNPDVMSSNFEGRALLCSNSAVGGGYARTLLINPNNDYNNGVSIMYNTFASNLQSCNIATNAYTNSVGWDMLSDRATYIELGKKYGTSTTVWPDGLLIDPPTRFTNGGVFIGTPWGMSTSNMDKGQLLVTGGVGIGAVPLTYTPGTSNLYKISNNFMLDVLGVIRATDVYASSDARIKSDIQEIQDALEKIKRMRGVTFVKSADTHRTMGLIAQETLDVVPEAVTEDANTFLSINYGALVGLLVEGIKEQAVEINGLKRDMVAIQKHLGL